MSEYTPTPNEARADFITLHTRNFDAYQVGRSLTSEQEFYGAQYDRMIAAIEREAAARALSEAATAFEATSHAWGKLAMVDHLRARAAEYRKVVES